MLIFKLNTLKQNCLHFTQNRKILLYNLLNQFKSFYN